MAEQEPKKEYLKYTNLGINLTVGFCGFTFLGIWLDNKFQRNNIFTIIGIFLGFAYFSYEIWKLLKDINKQ